MVRAPWSTFDPTPVREYHMDTVRQCYRELRHRGVERSDARMFVWSLLVAGRVAA